MTSGVEIKIGNAMKNSILSVKHLHSLTHHIDQIWLREKFWNLRCEKNKRNYVTVRQVLITNRSNCFIGILWMCMNKDESKRNKILIESSKKFFSIRQIQNQNLNLF